MIFVLAVPALLVVVVGYAVGYALWDWLGGLVDDAIGTSLAPHAEVAGWIAGLLLLAVLVRLALVRRRRARARRRPRT